MMHIYSVRMRPRWAEFGEMLVNGFVFDTEKKNDLLHLARTGPFLPPITMPSNRETVLLTNTCRQNLEASDLGSFEFRPVIKHHISRYDWHLWDLRDPRPAEIPQQPEDYVLAGEHSVETAEEMDDIWELIMPEATITAEGIVWTEIGPLQSFTVRADSWDGSHLFWAASRRSLAFMATDKGRAWLQRVAGEWLVFAEGHAE